MHSRDTLVAMHKGDEQHYRCGGVTQQTDKKKRKMGNQEGQRKLPMEHRGDVDVGRRKRIKGGEGDGNGREEERMLGWENFVNGKKRNERHVSENESCVGEGEERASNH